MEEETAGFKNKYDQKFFNYLAQNNSEEQEAKFEVFRCNICDKYIRYSSIEKLRDGFDKHKATKQHKINQLLALSKNPEFLLSVNKLKVMKFYTAY